jgi:hypothetical protein
MESGSTSIPLPPATSSAERAPRRGGRPVRITGRAGQFHSYPAAFGRFLHPAAAKADCVLTPRISPARHYRSARIGKIAGRKRAGKGPTSGRQGVDHLDELQLLAIQGCADRDWARGATLWQRGFARSRPVLSVSVPIDWSELDTLAHSAYWTIANIDSRLATGNSSWKAYPTSIQSLSVAMKTLGYASNKT